MTNLATAFIGINVRRNAERFLAQDSVAPALPGLEVYCKLDTTEADPLNQLRILGFRMFRDALDAHCTVTDFASDEEAMAIALASLIRWAVAHAEEIRELSAR